MLDYLTIIKWLYYNTASLLDYLTNRFSDTILYHLVVPGRCFTECIILLLAFAMLDAGNPWKHCNFNTCVQLFR